MKTFFTTIKYDYLQRTRSYAFLVTACVALAIGYSFVPEPNANYSTIRIGEYLGVYNSPWIANVTAIMTSIFLSLIGFYLINNSISNDLKTKMGQLVAATTQSNFKYLLAKVLSNFLVLLTIAMLVFLMSIILFFSYHAGYPFELFEFICPYLIITVPALFVIAVLAIVFEVLFGRFSILQNIAFFFLFATILVFKPKNETAYAFDVFGSAIVMKQMEEAVSKINGEDAVTGMNIGFVINQKKVAKPFKFEGVDFPALFLVSRGVWMLVGLGFIAAIAPFFNRFNAKERQSRKRKTVSITSENESNLEVQLNQLPKAKTNFGVLALLKVELLLLFRKGKKWLWLVNLAGMALLVFLPLGMAHQIVLPILWFLQVGRLSDLTSKEVAHKVHYFAFTSFKPLSRLLASQVIAASLVMLTLAMPLVLRLAFAGEFMAMSSVVLGGVFIVMIAAVFGILTKGKKLFEVLFFMVTYANINGIQFLDYFGATYHEPLYLMKLLSVTIVLTFMSFILRKQELRR